MPTSAIKKIAKVPKFALYGEGLRPRNGEFVHVELIETRSRLHDWHIDMHTHDGLFQVLFLLEGEAEVSMDGIVRTCQGPIAITLHPAVVHGFSFSEATQGYVFTVDQQVVLGTAGSELLRSLFVRPLTIELEQTPELHDRVYGLLENLMAELSWPQLGHTIMLEWLARSVLLLLARIQLQNRIAHQSGHGDLELFTRFRTQIELHFKEGWQVGDYAAALHLTPSRLNRLSLKVAGKTAFDIGQDRLMLEACRKLSYTSSSIASIAYELGFQDPAYFSRTFRKRSGLTPKQFREQPITMSE